MTHDVFSIVASVDPGRLEDLERFLLPIQLDPARNPRVPFGTLSMVHFASFVVFPPPVGSGDGPDRIPELLVFESCVDGPIEAYLDALLHCGWQALHDIFSCCSDYEAESRSPEALRAFLLEHCRRPHLLHIGNPGMRVDHVTSGAVLRHALDAELDAAVEHGRPLDRPLDLMRSLRERLHAPPSRRKHWYFQLLEDDGTHAPRPSWFADQQSFFKSRLWHWTKFTALLAVPFLLTVWGFVRLVRGPGVGAALLTVAAGAIVVGLFWRWFRTGGPLKAIDLQHVRAVKQLEDVGVQNKMASLVLLKPGLVRWLATRAVLGTFNLIYRTWFTDVTPGKLAGLHTIHFGHWTILDLQTEGGATRKGLMFLSNYDGSWESYLDDFLEYLFNGVVAIWASGVDFPAPLDGPTFKAWARTRMSAWKAWYQAYPELTVANIENSDRIRTGLVNLPKTDDAARLWLSRFGSFKSGKEFIEPPGEGLEDALDNGDIQGLVLSGYAHLPRAAYLLFTIEDAEAARLWLKEVLPRITDANPNGQGTGPATNLAFTYSGLEALGLDETVLARFPIAFREGMAPRGLDYRSRALGDVGINDPRLWDWGGTADQHKRIDVLLMLFEREDANDGRPSDARITSAVERAVAQFERSGAGTLATPALYGALLGEGQDASGRTLFREHFGFADGISQPEIEGSRRASRRVNQGGSRHLVKPGEFLLGHLAGDGTITPGIPMEARLDLHGLLPSDRISGAGFRQFGRNGTFLVFRQLQQDVPAFREFLAEAAGPGASVEDRRELAARMVGRREDGTPLVSGAAGSTSNEFDFSSDPHGFACPIGAHIRRANPRDSLTEDSALALKSANRHRLLRRGRPYGPPLDASAHGLRDEPRGMHFICLNADFERQFEFVQQNWINNPVFGGLACERDPLVGASTARLGTLTVQSPGVRQRARDIPSFVTVKGGGYFFLPSLRALRHLASLTSATAAGVANAMSAPVLVDAQPARTQPSRLRRGLIALERALPLARLAWAARFPLLLAFLLVFWPVAAVWKATYLGSHFLIGWWGLVVVSALASLAGFVVMVTLRLVLLYGWRSRPGRPRWTGSARWFQVLGFQALALPLVITAVHESASDAANAALGSYWERVLPGLGAAAIGMVAALLLLTLATSLQALRPGSRPDLFFPPNPLFARLSGTTLIRLRLHRVSGWLSRLSRWIVNSVPEEIGTGYIDYRRQRILPGHVFAATFAGIVMLLYGIGYLVLNPAWHSPWTRWGHEVPALAYLTFMLIAFGWLLSLLAFFFDRYGIPTLLPLAVWLALVASMARTDHFYKVHDIVEPEPLPPSEVVRRASRDRVIVVASEGLGLTSSAWTADVLATLAERAGGRQFTESLRLVSASSGAALGTMYFVEAYEPSGFPTDAGSLTAINRETLARIRDAARQPSDSENAWGLVYPDLVRTFAPLLVPNLIDRGWAMEESWKRRLREPNATLNDWRRGVAEGWRPAMSFGTTIVETGGRHLFATYDANACADGINSCVDLVTDRRDVSIATAARMASTFPYVSPVARAQLGSPAYHLADGGFWDNYGIVGAVEWLKQARTALASTPVLLIEIRSLTAQHPAAPEERAWLFELVGPLRTMNEVRTNAQRARNDLEVGLLEEHWMANGGPPIARAVFQLSDPDARLSWRIGHGDIARMQKAWSLHSNQTALATVRAFLNQK